MASGDGHDARRVPCSVYPARIPGKLDRAIEAAVELRGDLVLLDAARDDFGFAAFFAGASGFLMGAFLAAAFLGAAFFAAFLGSAFFAVAILFRI